MQVGNAKPDGVVRSMAPGRLVTRSNVIVGASIYKRKTSKMNVLDQTVTTEINMLTSAVDKDPLVLARQSICASRSPAGQSEP